MTNRNRLRWPKRLLVFVVLGSALAGGGWYFQRSYRGTPPSYQITVVTRGELLQVVTASGQLNPVLKVEVGSQISGNIDKLLVDFNALVRQGQVIAKLDPATYEANFIQADGNLANAKAALELAKLNADRAKVLRADKLNPQADYDKALADLHQAEANVKINEGALKKAQVDLSRCTIYAPIDGVVISRNVNVGQTVAASLSAPILFVIANDLSKMQIEASVAEADIGLVEAGQEIEFTVDAFPGRPFHGKVTQIRNAPRADQNVVTYDTIIEVSNPDLKLKPGMTANVSIIVARRESALRLANAALRFHPPENSVLKKVSASTNQPEAGSKTSKRKKDKRKAERIIYVLSHEQPLGTASGVGGAQTILLVPTQIKTGLTDGSATEVLEGLSEGDEVVTGLAPEKASLLESFNPFASRRKRTGT